MSSSIEVLHPELSIGNLNQLRKAIDERVRWLEYRIASLLKMEQRRRDFIQREPSANQVRNREELQYELKLAREAKALIDSIS